MNTPKPTFVREVARIDDPQFVSGQAAGHRARRLIDAPDAAFADPFVLMAEDWTSQGAFAFHPHRGIETVTFVIEGAIEHRDSAGFGGVIHAGGAQWMTAGRGVQHEENPPAGTTAHTLQLWVNLPAAEKMAVPRYQDLEASALPVRSENGVEIRVFSGAYGDMISPTLNHHPVTMLEVRVENGGAFRHVFAGTDNAFVYVLEGAVEIGPSGDLLEANQLGWLTRSEEPVSSQLTMKARGNAGRFLLFAAQPLREPIAFGGPFVINTQAEIQQAFADYLLKTQSISGFLRNFARRGTAFERIGDRVCQPNQTKSPMISRPSRFPGPAQVVQAYYLDRRLSNPMGGLWQP